MLREVKRIAVISKDKKRLIGFTIQEKRKDHWENFCIGFVRLDIAIEWLEDFAFMYFRETYRIWSEVEGLVVYE